MRNMPNMKAERLRRELQPARTVALEVVAGPAGVLAKRRRDGIPLWVFPEGKVEPRESPEQAASREWHRGDGPRRTGGAWDRPSVARHGDCGADRWFGRAG